MSIVKNCVNISSTITRQQIRTFAKKGKKTKQQKQPPAEEAAPTATMDDDDDADGHNDDDINDDDEGFMQHDDTELPSPDAVKDRMSALVASMERAFQAVRGGDPSPEMFESLPVKAYGSTAPLGTVAQVVIESPTRAVLTCYDPGTVNDVRDAVRDCGLGFNPRIEDVEITVPIPRVSTETRLALVKELGKTTERYRKRIRNVRRKTNDRLKKGKEGKLEGVSKDDAFRVSKDIDKVTDDVMAKLSDMLQQKEKTLMDV